MDPENLKKNLPFCFIVKLSITDFVHLMFLRQGFKEPDFVQNMFSSFSTCLLVTEEISITVARRAPDKEARPSPYHYCSLLLDWRYHLTSIELRSAYFDLETYTVLTHQQIPLQLAKSALSCWMYPTAQITLSPTPSHPWVPPE